MLYLVHKWVFAVKTVKLVSLQLIVAQVAILAMKIEATDALINIRAG